MQLGLVENDPTTGPAASAMKGRVQLAGQARSGLRMWRRGPRARHELTICDFRYEVARNASQVLIGGLPARGIGHRLDSLAESTEPADPVWARGGNNHRPMIGSASWAFASC